MRLRYRSCSATSSEVTHATQVVDTNTTKEAEL